MAVAAMAVATAAVWVAAVRAVARAAAARVEATTAAARVAAEKAAAVKVEVAKAAEMAAVETAVVAMAAAEMAAETVAATVVAETLATAVEMAARAARLAERRCLLLIHFLNRQSCRRRSWDRKGRAVGGSSLLRWRCRRWRAAAARRRGLWRRAGGAPRASRAAGQKSWPNSTRRPPVSTCPNTFARHNQTESSLDPIDSCV